MNGKIAVVLGATGLIGADLLRQLLADREFEKVRILVRRPVEPQDTKLETRVIDFNDPVQFREAVGSGDVMFSCIGTTNKKVKGDQDAYRKIDYDIPVHAATFAAASGFQKFLMISSAGANLKSSNFYLRLKGEVEEAVATIGIPSIAIFRPGFLIGNRKEKRTGEELMKSLMPVLSFLFIGPLKKYRPVKAEDLAAHMIAFSKTEWKGVAIKEG